MRGCAVPNSVAHQAIKDARGVEVLPGTLIDRNSRIGSYTYIGRNTTITQSAIGRYCSIGNNVTIGPGEHVLHEISTSALFYENPWSVLTRDDVYVGDDVWIGVNAIVLRGVDIGIGAVIAAGAVVTKSVPPFAIVAGVPARIIGYRFPEDKQKAIMESLWWEADLVEARVKVKQLGRDNEFS